ncbi:MAG: acyl-CoA dehydrogenase, partial [Dehalococcoidia bacterium]|nr:acyl-CoA dehydrogenase [Dehalococcoidia bacterium]
MDLALTEAQDLLRNSARDFVATESPRQVVRELDDTPEGYSPEMWRKMADLGWVGLIIPAEYGGAGGNIQDACVLFRELGIGVLPSPLHSSGILSALLIMEGGTAEQKRQLLPSIASGQQIFAVAFTEPTYGWGPENIHLAATQRGSNYVLSGTKLFANDAHVADQIIVVARTGQNISLFLVPKGTRGLSVRNMPSFSGEKFNEVTLDNVEVPASNIIGGVGGGWAVWDKVQDKAAVTLSAYMVGGCDGAYEMAVNYSNTRVQFGQPIGRFQRVQDHLINAVTWRDGALWTMYEAAWKLDENKEGASEAVAVA